MENTLEDHIPQQIKQLRTACIFEQKKYMVGVITNTRDWIFTQYDLEAECNREKIDNEIEYRIELLK